MMNWKTPLFDLNYDQKETIAVNEVLDSKWLTMGQKTIEFEENFASFLSHKDIKCSFVSNCSSALFMSLIALNIKAGDEVIIPALTFAADINCVLMAGAKPVLADCSSYSDWNMSAETIKPLITPKTKAVIIVHFGGYPCDMNPIIDLCKENGIKLIEDVAHAPGATYKGQKCGTFGDIGCFSFFTNKNLSIGEGGMLSTKNEELHNSLKLIRSHGMTSLTLDRHKGRSISYDITRPGLNFRGDEIRAALGIVQLSKLEEANKKRKEIVNHYIERLKDNTKLSIPTFNTTDIESAYHIFPILLDNTLDRISVIESLKNNGIQSSIHYPSFHSFTAYSKLNESPIASNISERELTLPLFPDMNREQVNHIAEVLNKL